MSDTDNEKETVEALTARLPGLTDDELTALHEAEAAGENRTTALAAIDREIKRRDETAQAEKAEADAAAKAEADQQAQAEGFIDAAARERIMAENEAKAEQARKDGAKEAAKKAARAEKAAAARPAGALSERLAGTLEAGGFDLAFGSDIGPETPPIGGFGIRKSGEGRFVSTERGTVDTSKLTGTVTLTHAWLIDGKTPVSVAELPSPITIGPNEQIAWAPGTLAFA